MGFSDFLPQCQWNWRKVPPIKIQLNDSYPYHVLSPGPDIVGGNLAYWVCHTLFSLLCPHEQMLDGTQLC